MKAQIEFDDNGYIETFCTDDINGEYELPDDFDCDYLTCYHLVDGELILNEEMKEEQDEENAKNDEIAELQKELDDTDYLTARCFEEVMALDNKLTFIVDMIGILVKYSNQYKSVLAQRKAWRARIEELRDK